MGSVFSFRLFGIPVRVRGTFLIIAVGLGLLARLSTEFIIAWVLIVFVSILVHELGHALTAIGFGARVDIELNGFGGLTRWSMGSGELSPGRRFLVAGAGSAFGLAFGGAVWLIAGLGGPHAGLTSFVLETLVRVNVFWGLLNWLPMRPLDGGHLLMSFLEGVIPRRAEMIARGVFVLTAGAGLLVGLQAGFPIIAVLAGWLLLSEFSTSGSDSPQPIPPLSYEEPEPDERDR